MEYEWIGERQKRFTFLSLGKKYYINKVLENSNLRVAYKPQFSIKQLLKLKFSINDGNKFQGSGIYQLICGGCGKKYTGQKGRNFERSYEDHWHSIRNKNTNSKFARHVLENGHAIRKLDYLLAVMQFYLKRNTYGHYGIFLAYRD